MQQLHVEVSPNVVYNGYALGRHVEHDLASWAYAVDHTEWFAQLGPLPSVRRAVLWDRLIPILNQGRLGSCTGNALTGWLGTRPFADTVMTDRLALLNEDYAVRRYSRGTEVDAVSGQYPPTDTGSTGNGVCKAARLDGIIPGYGWAFTTTALIKTLLRQPVIVGVPWYERMFDPTNVGEVLIGGQVVGGHEFLIRGYDPAGGGMLSCDNSWDTTWGLRGSFLLSVATWNQLRRQRADVTVPGLQTA